MLTGYFKFKPQDLLASLVVFIVAVPLSLGIAVATGTSVESSLIAAVIGGVVVGLFAGCPLMVSGPAAGLIVLIFHIVQAYGPLGLAVSVFFGGVLQILFGVMRAGFLFTLIPAAILHGMLAAIGLIILLGQSHVMMGQKVPNKPVDAFLQLLPSLKQGLSHEAYFITPVFACGLLAIAIQIIWPKVFSKLKWLPGALPAVIVVTLVSLLGDMDRLNVQSLIPVVKAQAATFFQFGWLGHWQSYMVQGFTVALVASAESLLTARAMDILDLERRKGELIPPSNLNQELLAQGLANASSGILGGLPITGVIVRSSANINAGGETRWSAILHGLWILVFIMLAPDLLKKVPLTALAAILVVTGFKLLNFEGLKQAFRHDAKEGHLWVITMAAIVATDLLKGLCVGIAVAILWHLEEIFAEERERLRAAILEEGGNYFDISNHPSKFHFGFSPLTHDALKRFKSDDILPH